MHPDLFAGGPPPIGGRKANLSEQIQPWVEEVGGSFWRMHLPASRDKLECFAGFAQPWVEEVCGRQLYEPVPAVAQ